MINIQIDIDIDLLKPIELKRFVREKKLPFFAAPCFF